MAHRLIGRWRLGSGAVIKVLHVYPATRSGPKVARVSTGLRQIMMKVGDLDTIRRSGGMFYVGR